MQVPDNGLRLQSLGGDGSLEMADRVTALRALLRDDAEQVVAHVPRRIDLQTAAGIGRRFIGAAGVHHQLGEDL